MANLCALGVVHFVVFMHIVLGFVNIIKSCIGSNVNGFAVNPTKGIIGGIVSITLGCILLRGVIKRNTRIVFTYFCISVVANLISTVALIYLLFEAPADFFAVVIVVVALLFVWSLEFGVYLYYKDLENEQNALAVSNRTNTVSKSCEYKDIDIANVDVEKNVLSSTKQNNV